MTGDGADPHGPRTPQATGVESAREPRTAQSRRAPDHVGRPATREAAVALLLACVCAWFVAGSSNDRFVVAVSAVGWGTVVAGDATRRRVRPVAGRAVTLVGVFTVLGAVAAMRPEGSWLELVPDGAGLLGVALVALGGLPLRRGWGRPLLAWGGVALVVAVFAEVLVYPVRPVSYLLSLALAVLAWEVGEHGVSLGEQVGRHGATRAVTRPHLTGSSVAGASGVALAVGVSALGGVSLPPLVVATLVCSGVVLLGALYS